MSKIILETERTQLTYMAPCVREVVNVMANLLEVLKIQSRLFNIFHDQSYIVFKPFRGFYCLMNLFLIHPIFTSFKSNVPTPCF